MRAATPCRHKLRQRNATEPVREPVRRVSCVCKAGAESGSAEASHGRAGKADGGEPLPSVFNMQETLLLAGFSFEAYNEPTGGVEDVDARGSRTRFTSPFVKEVFDGVVEVYVKRARDLPTPDLFGTADPYVRMSFGGNTKATSVKQFTANPVWDEPLRILWREGVSNTQLSIRVLDKDMMGSDDDLGWATLDVGHLMDGSQHELEVRLGSVPNSRVKGKGSVQLSVRCHRFSRDPIQAAHDMVLKGAKLMPHGVADLFEGIVVSMSRFHMEIQRKEWEKQLWAAPHDWEWCALATERGCHLHTPRSFEKVCFQESSETDTQVAVWRQRGTKRIAVAFRGTEIGSPTDFITDMKLAPTKLDSASDDILVHGGFLEAYRSVRKRLMEVLDILMEDRFGIGGGKESDRRWEVYVTGHSLGGALAKLMAFDLASSVERGERQVDVAMYSFGSPRVGNANFAIEYNRLVSRSIRVVNGTDVVVALPALMGYRHVRHGVRLWSSGELSGENDESHEDQFEPSQAKFAPQLGFDDASLRDLSKVLECLADRQSLENHFEDKYFSALKAIRSTSGES